MQLFPQFYQNLPYLFRTPNVLHLLNLGFLLHLLHHQNIPRGCLLHRKFHCQCHFNGGSEIVFGASVMLISEALGPMYGSTMLKK